MTSCELEPWTLIALVPRSVSHVGQLVLAWLHLYPRQACLLFFFFGAGLNGTKPTLAWLDGNNAPTTERRRRRLEDYLSVTCPGLVEWRIK